MAAVATQLTPSSAFRGVGGLRAAGVYLETWLIVLTTPTTAVNITTNKITHPTSADVLSCVDASDAGETQAFTPLSSGTSLVALSGLTTDTTYIAYIRGGR